MLDDPPGPDPGDERLYRNGPLLRDVIIQLAEQEPVFHSEADLQHHLAWVLRGLDCDLSIRLETRPLPGERLALDLLLIHRSSGQRVAVELKYPTRSLRTTIAGETFELRNHAAQDVTRYDIIKDITRLERLVTAGVVDRGWALVITNDQGFWTLSARSTVDAAFRLHEGRTLTGTLDWAGAGAGTTTGRDQPLTLTGTYTLAWQQFSTLPEPVAGTFRLLAVGILPAARHGAAEPRDDQQVGRRHTDNREDPRPGARPRVDHAASSKDPQTQRRHPGHTLACGPSSESSDTP